MFYGKSDQDEEDNLDSRNEYNTEVNNEQSIEISNQDLTLWIGFKYKIK